MPTPTTTLPITLHTLPLATPMQVFTQVRDHLLTQNRKAVRGSGYCGYRDESNGALRCAAGCIIADNEYVGNMEHVSWRSLINGGQVPAAHARLVLYLQSVHDDHYPPEWPRLLDFLFARVSQGDFGDPDAAPTT